MLRTSLALPLVLTCAIVLGTPDSAAAQTTAPRRQASASGAQGRVVWPDEGPRTWTVRTTSPEITANDLRTRLYQFADDSMMGRRIGELGNYKGTAYIAREFQRMGLEPAGDNGTYFQELPYGPIGFDSAASRLLAGGRALMSKREWIPIVPSAANGLGDAMEIANATPVFAGRWDDTAALDPSVFRGKIAVFAGLPANLAAGGRGGGRRGGGTPPSCDSVPDRFGAAAAIRADSAARAARGAGGNRGRGRGRGFGGGQNGAQPERRAAAAGAVGVLFIGLETLPARSVDAVFATRSIMQPQPRAGIGGAVISSAAATRLFGRPAAQLTVGATGQPVTARWHYQWTKSKTPARNVIAIRRGSDPARANEYVLVSAHNDHVGTSAVAVDHDSLRAVNMVTRRQGANDPVCRPTSEQQHIIDSLIARARSIRPPRRDSIFNGADDDGSGTVVLLEIAEKFASEHPARSIIFVSHTGEEGGLLGSRWFTDHPTVPLSSVVAAHNMDMVGKGRADQVKFGGPASVQMLGSRRLSREFGDIIDSVNAIIPEPMAIDRSWDVTANPMNRFCRSDQVNYVHHNVPVTYFSLGYAEDYHQLTDEPQYVEYDHTARLGRFIHAVMLAIADRPDRPAIAGPDPAYPACR